MDILQLNSFNKKKRERIRLALRNNDILPKYGQELTSEQKLIDDRISENDFSVFDELKILGQIKKPMSPYKKISNKKRVHKESERPVLKRARILYQLRNIGILPPLGDELTEEQQNIVDYVTINYETPILSFIEKHHHMITPEYRMWYKTKKYVNKFPCRNREFSIEPSDIIIPKYCPYLEIELSTDAKDRNKPHYFSIDRIDSNLGYIKGNVQIISKKANTMKSNATTEELITFAKNILSINS
jgi:hypothetical protein